MVAVWQMHTAMAFFCRYKILLACISFYMVRTYKSTNLSVLQEVMLKKGLAWHYAAYDKRIELANVSKQQFLFILALH